jgi:hypothetical protein
MALWFASNKKGDEIDPDNYGHRWVTTPLPDVKGLTIVGMIEDDEASYSFDDWALLKAGKKFYLVSAAGCSCPTHEETAQLEVGPATLKEIRERIESGDYRGYTLPTRQADEFDKLLKFAAGKLTDAEKVNEPRD